MQRFREIFAEADAKISDRLLDDATIDGVDVRGELAAPVDQAGLSGGMTGLQGYSFRIGDVFAGAVVIGSEVVSCGKTFAVVNIYPEGTGITTLELRLKE
ncbi:hypothetical protein [Prosthecochloris sp.]|uniref:hypothetical protein n=1 Tax=Prosthecochloris sp. TaxID=290513 RepID=UPI0025EE056A|nr:hypothetical protein [Prosthecochloris sp.]